jgi:copper chaperone NosL
MAMGTNKGAVLVRLFGWLAVALACAGAAVVAAGAGDPHEPKTHTRCPVCGMFVSKYPDFIATITFASGRVEFFDGTKDMLKYYFNLKKYNPGESIGNIASLAVTEYYQMNRIDARKAYFVMGSQVYGPMGRELIPLTSRDDAAQFMKDHLGKRIIRFEEITPAMVRSLD